MLLYREFVSLPRLVTLYNSARYVGHLKILGFYKNLYSCSPDNVLSNTDLILSNIYLLIIKPRNSSLYFELQDFYSSQHVIRSSEVCQTADTEAQLNFSNPEIVFTKFGEIL